MVLMRTVVPSYYTGFRCIADKCKHSCCVGWEIDIDEDTMALYDDPHIPLYKPLQQHIDRSTDTPHFRLDERERCPFLTSTGLCRIIQTMGEESLCQICADHPRFRNYFSDRTEIGLGLCCEAAAMRMLHADHVRWIVLDDDGIADTCTPEECDFLTRREQIYAILQDRETPLSARLDKMLTICHARLPQKTVGAWTAIYRALEQLDPTWDKLLSPLAADDTPLQLPIGETIWDMPLENLALYFTFRHLADALDDDRLAARAAFCVLSVSYLYALLAKHGDNVVELARLYSSEIEYSEENMETLLTLLEEA